MAQGKMKVNAKSPKGGKKKAGRSPKKQTKRLVAPKKAKQLESHKLKLTITKTINQSIEENLQAKATQEGKPLRVVGTKAASTSKPKAKPKGKKAKGKGKKK